MPGKLLDKWEICKMLGLSTNKDRNGNPHGWRTVRKYRRFRELPIRYSTLRGNAFIKEEELYRWCLKNSDILPKQKENP